jgi:hypothetical protein
MLRIMFVRMSLIAWAAFVPGVAVQDPEVSQPVAGLERALWRPERAELWLLCRVDGSEQVRVFNPWLQELAAPLEAMPEGGYTAESNGRLEMPAWAGHRLECSADGRLSLSRRPWETAPRLVWGPGWAALEVRSTVPLTSVPWRRAGDAEMHLAPVRGDAADGIQQRAHLLGLQPGEVIEVGLPPMRWVFPQPTALEWRSFLVPAVDPAGERPTSEWPSD